MERTGGCLCGALRYTAKGLEPNLSACHCGMCRRWAGGPFMGTNPKEIVFENEDTLQTYASSSWAERAFCSTCGTSLFYRVTQEGPHHGFLGLAFGSLDDQTGFSLKREWYIDLKPAGYTFEDEAQTKLTSVEIEAMFADASN